MIEIEKDYRIVLSGKTAEAFIDLMGWYNRSNYNTRLEYFKTNNNDLPELRDVWKRWNDYRLDDKI